MKRFANSLAALGKKVRTVSDAVSRLTQARTVYGASWWPLIRRFMTLYLVQKYSPQEIFLWGLADPTIGDRDLDAYISKEKLLRLQRLVNPGYASVLTEDKSIFYLYCSTIGIPVPQLFAIVEPDFVWTAEGQILTAGHRWSEFIGATAPADLIVKPTRGVYAQDVWAFQWSGSMLIDHEGRTLDADELLERLRRNRRYRSFIVQQRIRCHPIFEELSGTRALQTLRVVTGVQANGEAEILLALIKIICGASVSDNFAFGTSTNMLGDIDPVSGQIGCVVTASGTRLGTEVVTRHPKTGRMFSKLEIPHWTEAVAMLRDAATKFLPLKAIGWDLAITADGPVVIEGNAWWDPLHNAHRKMDAFRSYLERSCVLEMT